MLSRISLRSDDCLIQIEPNRVSDDIGAVECTLTWRGTGIWQLQTSAWFYEEGLNRFRRALDTLRAELDGSARLYSVEDDAWITVTGLRGQIEVVARLPFQYGALSVSFTSDQTFLNPAYLYAE